MQLTGLSNKIIPLTLAAGLAVNPFFYADVDAHSGIVSSTNNNKVFEYISSVDEGEVVAISNKLRFQFLLNSWQQQTKFSSSPDLIVQNENFQSIVAMGKAAIPFIVEEISANPSTLVWALNFIFEKKISDNPRTTIPQACKLWVNQLTK
jgi:hypothetical protein